MALKKIVLLTTGQPSTNPRLVKEADTLHEAGYDVFVLYCHVINWAIEKDKDLLSKVKWKYYLIGGAPNQSRLIYLFTKIRYRFCKILNRFGNKFKIAERVQARAYDELLIKAKSLKADLYIGHNLGTLSVAVKSAKANASKAGFDFEDYHRGEESNSLTSDLERIVYLEEKYVNKLNFINTSSPLIAEKIALNFPSQKDKIFTILNCFPFLQNLEFKKKSQNDNSLKLFWFSQTIGFNRGLEDVIRAIEKLADPEIYLYLAGRWDEEFKKYVDKNTKKIQNQICYLGILSPEELPQISANYDVGLTLELGGSENNMKCLSNKVFTYFISGNAIIASDTDMQKEFFQENKTGTLFIRRDLDSLKEAVLKYKNYQTLTEERERNYRLATDKFNWEVESNKFLAVINSIWTNQ